MKLRLGWDPLTGRAILSENVPSRARYAASGGSLMAIDVQLPDVTDAVGAGPVERRFLSPDELAAIRVPVAPRRAPVPQEPRVRTTAVQVQASRMRGLARQRQTRVNLAKGREVALTNQRARAIARRDQFIAVLRCTGSLQEAADAMGVSKRRVQQVVEALRRDGAMPHDVAERIRLRGRGPNRVAA